MSSYDFDDGQQDPEDEIRKVYTDLCYDCGRPTERPRTNPLMFQNVGPFCEFCYDDRIEADAWDRD